MADQNRDDKKINERQELEHALALLRPAASSLDRDRFLFLAGRASAEGSSPAHVPRWMWPAATCLSSLAAVVLLVLLVMRTGPEANRAQRSKLVGTNRLFPRSHPSPWKATLRRTSRSPRSHVSRRRRRRRPGLWRRSNYPRLRSFVLAYGIDALPEPAPLQKSESSSQADREPATVRDLLLQTLQSRSKG